MPHNAALFFYSFGQLIRENNKALDKTYIYSYNEIGNITEAKEYPYTTANTPTGTPTVKSYTYDSTQKDRLTSFGGNDVTYNTLGGVASYDGWNYTWSKGKLSSIRKELGSSSRAVTLPVIPSFSSSKTYSFTYNGLGQRIGSHYTYFIADDDITPVGQDEVIGYSRAYSYDSSGRLISESITEEHYGGETASSEIVFLYDENSMIGMQYTSPIYGTSIYYYFRNLMGDVIALYDANGNKVVEYLYDAWGNCTIKSTTTNYTVAHANPIRYRGYYYDEGTKLYFLNSRYYNPLWRRFISPDDSAYLDPESVNGLNLYAYCGNDPVNFADPSGHDPEWLGNLLIVGAGVLLIAGLAIATIATGGAAAGVAGAVFAGALKGALIGAAVGTVAGGAIGYAIDGVDGMWTGMAIGFTGGAVIGAVIGGTIGYYNSLIQVDINKFTNYVLDPSNSKGKHKIFKHLGYDKSNAKSLVRIYKKQGLKNYLLKKYSLGKIDLYGQRITMGIKIGDTVLKTGWMLLENGIRLITPFSGFLN